MSDDRGPRPRGRRQRLTIAILIGAIDIVGACVVAAVLVPPSWGRLVVLAVAIGLFAAVVDDMIATLATAALGYALYTSFLTGRFPDTAWDITTWIAPLLAFGLAVTIGRGQRRISRHLATRALGAAQQPRR